MSRRDSCIYYYILVDESLTEENSINIFKIFFSADYPFQASSLSSLSAHFFHMKTLEKFYQTNGDVLARQNAKTSSRVAKIYLVCTENSMTFRLLLLVRLTFLEKFN